MHHYVVPDAVKDRLLRRRGKLVSLDTIDAARTALVVVDMQNYFVAEGFPLEVPLARAIVPNINRMAKALRAAGGAVAWVQTSSARLVGSRGPRFPEESWDGFTAFQAVPGRGSLLLSLPRITGFAMLTAHINYQMTT